MVNGSVTAHASHYHDYIASLSNNDKLPTTDEIRKIAAKRECWAEIVVA